MAGFHHGCRRLSRSGKMTVSLAKQGTGYGARARQRHCFTRRLDVGIAGEAEIECHRHEQT